MGKRADIEEAKKETGRVEAISDGIFAIGMTLLVLDLHVPEIDGDQSLLTALLAEWPGYLAFLIGFFTLLVCWINHHFMFSYIRKSDGMLLLLNGFKMLVVSATPFVTALLARYIGSDNQQLVVSVYTGNFFFMGLSMSGLWLYSQSHGLTRATPAAALTNGYYVFAPILAGLIFLLSFVSIWACLALFCTMFAIYVFPAGLLLKLTSAEGRRGPHTEVAPPAE